MSQRILNSWELRCRDPPFKSVQRVVSRSTLKAFILVYRTNEVLNDLCHAWPSALLVLTVPFEKRTCPFEKVWLTNQTRRHDTLLCVPPTDGVYNAQCLFELPRISNNKLAVSRPTLKAFIPVSRPTLKAFVLVSRPTLKASTILLREENCSAMKKWKWNLFCYEEMKQAGECLQPIKTVLTGTMKQLKSVLLAMKKWIRLENASYLLQLFYYEEMKHQAGECLQPIECPIMKNLIWYWLTIKRISVENTLKAYQWAHASHLLTSCHFILLLGGTNLFEIVLLVGMKIALWCRDPPLKSVQFVVSRFTLKAITSLPFCYIVRPNVPITGKRGSWD